MRLTTQDLTRIARDIDRSGVAANEGVIAKVAGTARAAGVDPTLLSVLSDACAPEVARLRAFGMVATALAGTPAMVSDPQPSEDGQHPAMVFL